MANPTYKAFANFPWAAVAPTAILIGVFLLSLTAGKAADQVITEMMIRVVLVVGIYIFVGNSGVLSFGHIGFVAIGAYASAWFTCCTLPMVKRLYLPGLPQILQENAYPFAAGLLSAAVVAGSVALGVGLVICRLAGIAGSIATFAFLAIVYAVYSNWESVTGGTSSISNIPIYVDSLVATGAAIAAVWVAFTHQTSGYGLLLRATRDEPIAASMAGVRLVKVRLFAWVLSAIVVGVGGAFYASYIGMLTVDAFYLTMTFLALAMLIVGGIQSLAGAVVGVIALTVVTELFRFLETENTVVQLPKGLQEVGLGIVMILILIFRPKGIMNGREFSGPPGRLR
jgi:branched-chain amino acid transport system permease protein